MNNLTLLIVAVLLAPSALALALGFPNVGDIHFEPHKEVNLQYRLQNDLPVDLPVKAILSVPPELSDYVLLSKDVKILKANSSEIVVVTIKFPDELPYGLYSISFTAEENAPTQGAFVAHVGTSHTVKVINPYPGAKALLEFRGPEKVKHSGSRIEINVRNIGEEDLEDARLQATLTSLNYTKEIFSDRFTVPALSETLVRIPLELDLPYGFYTLNLNTTRGDHEGISTQLQLGEPSAKIKKINPHSFEHSNIELEVFNNWMQPLSQGTLALTIYKPGTKISLFEASATGITLQPGKNTVQLRIMKPRFLDNGKYPANLQILTPPFYLGAEGELEVKLTDIGKMLKDQPVPTDAAWQYENVMLDQPRMVKVANNKQLYLIVLVLVIAIFLFSVAMLFRKRRDTNAQAPPQSKA
jgi:hypothetical protein